MSQSANFKYSKTTEYKDKTPRTFVVKFMVKFIVKK